MRFIKDSVAALAVVFGGILIAIGIGTWTLESTVYGALLAIAGFLIKGKNQ